MPKTRQKSPLNLCTDIMQKFPVFPLRSFPRGRSTAQLADHRPDRRAPPYLRQHSSLVSESTATFFFAQQKRRLDSRFPSSF
jgi:hypothetical protein